ncbi:MAG: nitroreductase family protein [Desulfuromonadales bacterium]|nr:MAG: nitroreductase family protein [Desulfuromonadales bacterium]
MVRSSNVCRSLERVRGGHMEAYHTLKSTLCFSHRPVSGHLIRSFIRSAMAQQGRWDCPPLQYVVIDDRSLLEEIPTFHTSAQRVADAPVAILICSEAYGAAKRDEWFRACAAVSEHLLIAVQSHGLGAVRLCIHPLEERISGMQRLLGLPESIIPISLIPLGYPAEQCGISRRFDPSRVHYNHW